MKIIFTDHAKERMLLRGITEKMVKQTIAKPETKDKGYKNRLLFFKSFEHGTIKTVCVEKNNFYIIISVIWERRK